LNQRRKRKYFDKGNFDIKVSIVTYTECTRTVPDSEEVLVYIFYYSQTSRKEEKK
jgi:hypothetical protein